MQTSPSLLTASPVVVVNGSVCVGDDLVFIYCLLVQMLDIEEGTSFVVVINCFVVIFRVDSVVVVLVLVVTTSFVAPKAVAEVCHVINVDVSQKKTNT